MNSNSSCFGKGLAQSFVPTDLWQEQNPQYGPEVERMVEEFWMDHSFPHPMNRAVYLNDGDGNPQQHRVRLVKHADREKAHKAFEREYLFSLLD